MAGLPNYTVIYNEFEEIARSVLIFRTGRRQLLQILHSTRALDTSLRELMVYHGIPTRRRNSLGQYLRAFGNHTVVGVGRLPDIQRRHYQVAIVDQRNKYMHQAGAFPQSDAEIRSLLSEMQSCLFDVISL